jgi:hypothetical protein
MERSPGMAASLSQCARTSTARRSGQDFWYAQSDGQLDLSSDCRVSSRSGRLGGVGPPATKLFDHIWLSPTLAQKQTAAFIDRRSRHSGDGSDHDPASIALDL